MYWCITIHSSISILGNDMVDLNTYCEVCHNVALAKGFWEDNRPIAVALMLIVTELAEACEADRKGDKENFNEEIADTFIRLMDLCGYLKIDIEEEIQRKYKKNEKRPYKHGKRY